MDAALISAFPVAGADPMDRLAGLPLVLRTVLSLRKEGFEHVTVLVPEGRDDIVSCLGDARVRSPVTLHRCASEKAGLEALRTTATVPLLLTMPHLVVTDRQAYVALRQREDLGADQAIATTTGDAPSYPMVASAAFLGAASAAGLEAALRDDGRVQRIDDGKVVRVDTREGRDEAFYRLFEACRKPVDGIVARHINRHISIFISKRIVETPLTPNMMSGITFLLSVCAAASAARGGYWAILFGAFLFQSASILDGVDGELARVRFQHSRLGQWLDTVSDDASNLLFYAGLVLGSRGLPHFRPLAIAGAVAIVASSLITLQYYVELIEIGSGDLYAIAFDFDKGPPTTFLGRAVRALRYVVKKDFVTFAFLVLAAFGVLPYALFFIALGAVITLMTITRRSVGRWRTKRA